MNTIQNVSIINKALNNYGNITGIALTRSIMNTIQNVSIINKALNINQTAIGVYFYANSSYNVLINSTIYGPNYCIYFYTNYSYPDVPYDNIITHSILHNCSVGVYLNFETNTIINSHNFIYNNIFNVTNKPIVSINASIYLNVSKFIGNRIYRFGNVIGGNYYAYPNGTGFSQTCNDSNLDGFCDEPFIINNNTIDYLPLSNINPIGSCYSIPNNANGEKFYIVGNINYNNSSIGSACIKINANNVIINCLDHIISSNDSGIGIYSSRNTNQNTNITLYNCVFRDFKNAISFINSSENVIKNVSLYSNDYGIQIDSDTNTIYDVNSSYNHFGIYLTGNNNTLRNINVKYSDYYGIYIGDSSYDYLYDNVITQSSFAFRFNNDSFLEIHDNDIQNCTYAIFMNNSNGFSIYNNTISLNGYGLFIGYSGAINKNKIYNNLFNNTNNVYFYGSIYGNYWNTTETTSTNIIGENEIGGNFWANPNGTGFSETCPNANHDSFCDSPYELSTGNIDYLPLRYYNYPPEIKYVNLTILGFGTKNNFTITSNITDRDSITDADYMCFLNSCIKLGPTNTTELMDISDVFNTTSSDYVFVNDTYGASTDYQLYYSITNNSFNTDVVSYLDNQTIYKNDTICNLGNDKISYYINYSSLGGNVHTYNSRGVLLPSECKNVSAVWNGDWIYENISSEHVDPNYPIIANETVHTYFVITTNNTLFNFGNISVNVCRPGWTQNTSYISVPVGTSKYYIGCSKNGVIALNQSDIVLNVTPIIGVVVGEHINGYYEVNITNNDNLLNYSNVKVITNLPYPFVNTTPYTFNVNLTTSEKLTKFVYIRGEPVVEVSHLVSYNSIPSYKKYTYYAEIKVLNDGVSKYPVTYLINKSILEDFGKRNPALDKYFVDGKSDGVIVRENSTHLIITVETNFTNSSLHLGTHYITYTYYVYSPTLVGGGGSPLPKIEINPEKLNITINYPNLCNESIVNVTWYGNPQEAKIHLSKNIIKFVKSPMDGEKIWLNKHTVVPIKICIPREFVLNKTSVNIINGYMDIESQGTYGEVSDRLFITVHFNASNISNIEIQKTKAQPYIYIYAGLIILFVLLLSVFF